MFIFAVIDFKIVFSFFFILFILSFGLSDDDAYVDKLPTFERHFDSFAGIVPRVSKRRAWLGKGIESCNCHSCLMFFAQNALVIKGQRSPLSVFRISPLMAVKKHR